MRLYGNFITKGETEGASANDPKGKVTKCTIPASGYLNPQSQCYLPLTTSSQVMLYLKVAGFRKAEKDVIRIEAAGKKLKSQQGLCICPPHTDGTSAFHCALEVQEESIKMQDSTSHGSQIDVEEYSLIFHPSLTIQNLLPFPMDADLASAAGESVLDRLYELLVSEGESVAVCDFDLTKPVKLKAAIRGFEIAAPVDLRPSRKSKNAASVTERPVKFCSTKNGVMPGNHILQLKHLDLRLRETGIGMSGARRVTLFCPYWILNKTDKEILIKDRKTHFGGQMVLKPCSGEHEWTPVLFSSTKSTVFISVAGVSWSKVINLNSVGLKGTVHVLAPVDVDPDEETEVVFPHGVMLEREPLLLSFVQMRGALSFTDKRPPDEGPSREPSAAISDEEEDGLPPETKDKGPRFSRLEFSVSVHMGPGAFEVVKVLRISPRYILYNNSTDKLLIGQKGTKKVIRMEPGAQIDYYWHDSEAPQEICAKFAYGVWCYSGGFRLDQVNDFGLRIRNPRRKGFYKILQVDVSLKGDSMICAFCNPDDEYPPYKIDNRLESRFDFLRLEM